MVQVEELEARFADFDEFVVQLGEKRVAISSAFESRKIELIETRNRKANALLTSAERILKGIKHRADHAENADELNSYFAADAMVEKIRDVVKQLVELGDTVKADDLGSRLKSLREDAVRQINDRRELFAGGSDTIQLGRHQFLVNTQELDLTIVSRGETMCLHLTGTNFFEPIDDAAFAETRPVWSLELVSETSAIYRAEYLAFKMLENLETQGRLEAASAWTDEERLDAVRNFMAPRYAEGYVKGVHDLDAARILAALVAMHVGLGLLRHPTRARTLAALAWQRWPESEAKKLMAARLRGYATMRQLFPTPRRHETAVTELRAIIDAFLSRPPLLPTEHAAEAAEYLYHQLQLSAEFVVSPEALALRSQFDEHLTANHFHDPFKAARAEVETDFAASFELIREWMRSFAFAHVPPESQVYIDEASWLILRDSRVHAHASDISATREITSLSGNHQMIRDGKLPLNYLEFTRRLRAHDANVVPMFERFQARKRELVEQARQRLRLEDFKPKVLTSFVRNQLINAVYLPLIGDNLAKQIGAAGDAKRTDRMGMLLLLSPPGYGKTTLLEYIASRLGIVFMKVNGPAIGHRITSLDPAEAPNAAAREELHKLNLAFEMGDNVMVCLDDIQHLNPEFLQKFISLCDGSAAHRRRLSRAAAHLRFAGEKGGRRHGRQSVHRERREVPHPGHACEPRRHLQSR